MDIEIFVSGLQDSLTLNGVKEITVSQKGHAPVVLKGNDIRKLAIYPDHSYTIVSCNTVHVFSGSFIQLVEFPAID